MPSAIWYSAAVVILLLVHFGVSFFFHTQILGRLKARHYELWVALGSLTPPEALSRASVPGLFQRSGAISYAGWLHLKTYRDIGDPDISAWAGRLRSLNLVTIVVLGLVLIASAMAYGDLGRLSNNRWRGP